jgi:chemotaxis protein methyltransferase CheR
LGNEIVSRPEPFDESIPNSSHADIEDIEIQLLLEAIFLRYHYDFRGYAMASLKRRLKQALVRFQLRSFSNLQDLILWDSANFTRLLEYLTVQVSEMFRDPHYYRAIRDNVVPHLKTHPSIKVWVAGCSAGEELYSLAILFREEGLANRTIFYATDINPISLERAQQGIYALDRIAGFSSNYQHYGGRGSLSDYYTAAYGGARFDPTLTAGVVFSDHSLVTDSVFAEVHFISCRNVLIYFDRPVQDRAIGLFKESLACRGFLGLGSKESLRFTAHAPAFKEISSPHRIYQKLGDA